MDVGMENAGMLRSFNITIEAGARASNAVDADDNDGGESIHMCSLCEMKRGTATTTTTTTKKANIHEKKKQKKASSRL